MMRITNFYRLAALLLPVHLRGSRMLMVCRALVSPLYAVQRLNLTYHEKMMYKINHNSQVCSLQGVLNDALDSTLRRIRIIDPVRNDFLFLYKREEMKDVRLGRAFISRRDLALADQLDFLVKVPLEFESVPNEARLKALLNFYKLAGKQYRIDYERN